MRTDPRVGIAVSLILAAAATVWLVVQWLLREPLMAWLGYGVHAITLVSILVAIAGVAVALLFLRYWQVKRELLEGRDVIAHWSVSRQDFAQFAAVAGPRVRAEMFGALMLVVVLVVLIFGAFAVFDPEIAGPMLLSAGAVILLVTAAYFVGSMTRRSHLEPQDGEVIVGRHGLLVNGVLHVWSAWLAWLSSVELERGPPAILTITYAYLARYGPQYVTVPLPVPEAAMEKAEKVVETLGDARPPRRKRRAKPVDQLDADPSPRPS